MKLSVIIPFYNAERTLKVCMDAIFSSEDKDFEVIAVDDKSADRSSEIVRQYPCKLITLEKNRGAAFAKNIGKDNAQGDILVFTDSDVVIKKDTLTLIRKSFEEHKDIIAVTGIVAVECRYKDFFTTYKNLYMNYIFRKCPDYVDFLYGSIMAVKKADFLPFNEKVRFSEDTELGQLYGELGKKILLNKALEVEHIKEYTFKRIVINDFSVPFWWARSFLLHKGLQEVLVKGRFAHARMSQLLSILASYLFLAPLFFWNFPAGKIASFVFLAAFLSFNGNFFRFLYKNKGPWFLLRSIIFTFLDALVMGCGISAGMLRFGRSYNS